MSNWDEQGHMGPNEDIGCGWVVSWKNVNKTYSAQLELRISLAKKTSLGATGHYVLP